MEDEVHFFLDSHEFHGVPMQKYLGWEYSPCQIPSKLDINIWNKPDFASTKQYFYDDTEIIVPNLVILGSNDRKSMANSYFCT